MVPQAAGGWARDNESPQSSRAECEWAEIAERLRQEQCGGGILALPLLLANGERPLYSQRGSVTPSARPVVLERTIVTLEMGPCPLVYGRWSQEEPS